MISRQDPPAGQESLMRTMWQRLTAAGPRTTTAVDARERVFLGRQGSEADLDRGHVSASGPDSIATPALGEVLVRSVLEDSNYLYRPAEAISRDTRIELGRARRILETSNDRSTAPKQ